MQNNSKQHKNYHTMNESNILPTTVKSNNDSNHCLLVSRILFLSVVFLVLLLWIYYLTKIALKIIK